MSALHLGTFGLGSLGWPSAAAFAGLLSSRVALAHLVRSRLLHARKLCPLPRLALPPDAKALVGVPSRAIAVAVRVPPWALRCGLIAQPAVAHWAGLPRHVLRERVDAAVVPCMRRIPSDLVACDADDLLQRWVAISVWVDSYKPGGRWP